MDRNSFVETMEMIASAYCRNSLLEENVLMTWYKFLGNFDEKVFRPAAENYIRQNGKPPAISDLYAECLRIQSAEVQERETVEEPADDEEWWKYGPNAWED